MIPRNPSTATLIEYFHRTTSGLCLIFIAWLAWTARRVFPRGHSVRTAALLSLIFVLLEALIGAGLVLFELVAEDRSVSRALSISVHLTNTLLLVGALAATIRLAPTDTTAREIRARLSTPEARRGLMLLAWLTAVGATGAITALGDTLFPAASIAQGMEQHWSAAQHFLIRLRIYHPILAVAGALFAIGYARERGAFRLIWVIVGQLGVGALNVLLLAPAWMQLVHLLIADILWIGVVGVFCDQLSRRGLEPDESAVLAAHRVARDHA